MPIEFDIRLALESDASDISELIYATSIASLFSPEQPCPSWYRDSVSRKNIVQSIRSNSMSWLAAVQGTDVIGVLAVSEQRHIKYFFVHPLYQRKGVGSDMWRYAAKAGWFAETLTVRSSIAAVPIYERLGFKAVEPPNTVNGVCYQTMVANID